MCNNINTRLANLRKALGISQASFAEKIGISPNNISRYESGNRVPAENTILLICKTFDVNYDWLKNGNGEMFIKTDDGVKMAIMKMLEGKNQTAIDVFTAFADFDDRDWETVRKFINSLKK